MKMKYISAVVLSVVASVVVPASSALASPQQQDESAAMGQASDKPVSDAWITTKVKADLLASKDVSGLDIKVETTNGVVKLSGNVKNQVQADKAQAVAHKIDGVKSVDASAVVVAGATGY